MAVVLFKALYGQHLDLQNSFDDATRVVRTRCQSDGASLPNECECSQSSSPSQGHVAALVGRDFVPMFRDLLAIQAPL